MPRQPLFPGEDESRGDFYDNQNFETTFSQSMRASFDLAQQDTTLFSLGRIFSLEDAADRGGEKIPVNELNERFKPDGFKFEEDLTEAEAEVIINRKAERRRLQTIIANGPQGGFYDTSRFGASLVAHALDPIDFAVGVASGGVLAAAVKGKRIGRALGVGVQGARPVQKFAFNATEGILGNVAAEPLVYVANRRDLEDYSVEDAFINAAGGAVGFAGIRYGAGKAVNFIKRFPELHQRVQRTAIAQLMRGKKINVEPHIRNTVKEFEGRVEADTPGVRKYEFSSLSKSDLNNREFYVSNVNSVKSIKDIQRSPITDDFGTFLYMSDNPNVSNGVSGGNHIESHGSIFSVSLKDVRTLDFDQSLPSRQKAVFDRLLSESLPEGATLREALESIRARIESGDLAEDAFELVGNNLKAQGIDGYHGRQAKFLDQDHEPYNQVVLFDDSKVTQRDQFKPDSSLVRGITSDELGKASKDINDRSSDLDFDADVDNAVKEIRNQRIEDPEVSVIRQQEQELSDEIDSLEGQGLLSEGDLTEVQRVRDLAQQAEVVDTTTKAATACLARR